MAESVDVRLARLEERVKAAEEALKIASAALESYKTGANEWRQALNDQRLQYPTKMEVVAMVTIGLTLLGIVLTVVEKYIK
jgi:Tfp pilus assembly protein PilO